MFFVRARQSHKLLVRCPFILSEAYVHREARALNSEVKAVYRVSLPQHERQLLYFQTGLYGNMIGKEKSARERAEELAIKIYKLQNVEDFQEFRKIMYRIITDLHARLNEIENMIEEQNKILKDMR